MADLTDAEQDLLTFLEMAGQGCISGSVVDWPQLKPACKWAAEEIKRSIAAKLERPAGSLIRKARLEYNPERFTGTVTVAIEGMPFSMATGCEPVDGLPVKVTITPAGPIPEPTDPA